MPKRIGPEAKIITLFSALSEDSKRIVFDVIKGQMAAPRKASTKRTNKGVPLVAESGNQSGSSAV